MANLCVARRHGGQRRSALHSEILNNGTYSVTPTAWSPGKFKNVTNGIDHRRWLSQINPKLDGLIRDLTGGDDYLLHPEALKKLEDCR